MSDLVYPKNGGEFLLSRIKESHGQIADLIDELVKRDQELAQLRAANAQLVDDNVKLTMKANAPDGNPPQ